MGKMFKSVQKTWNVYFGCEFGCTYCWARPLANGRLKGQQLKYKNGFIPTFWPKDLETNFQPGTMVFVSDMGDISFATQYEIRVILERIHLAPKTTFLFCSKNPAKYSEWEVTFPDNVILGTTIETNRDTKKFSEAPNTFRRALALSHVPTRKFLAIEPIMDFDISEMLAFVGMINPCLIEIGADNYTHGLPEPSPDRLNELLVALKATYKVNEKDGLNRLLKEV